MSNLKGIAKMKAGGASKPHGCYLRYRAGCRCDECRAAENEYHRESYQRKKAGKANGIVSAEKARNHLQMLKREHGVTINAAALETGLRRATVMRVRNGTQLNLREQSERLILAVGPQASSLRNSAPAEPTRRRLEAISETGLTQKEIGQRLGLVSIPGIGRGARVQGEKARAVRRLYHDLVLMAAPRRGSRASPSAEPGVCLRQKD